MAFVKVKDLPTEYLKARMKEIEREFIRYDIENRVDQLPEDIVNEYWRIFRILKSRKEIVKGRLGYKFR